MSERIGNVCPRCGEGVLRGWGELSEEERIVTRSLGGSVDYSPGEREEAFAWLDLAYENRSEGMVWLKVDPTLDSLRASPRFAALLRGVGLTP